MNAVLRMRTVQPARKPGPSAGGGGKKGQGSVNAKMVTGTMALIASDVACGAQRIEEMSKLTLPRNPQGMLVCNYQHSSAL